MKVCFLLWSPDISGGTNVIFQHAVRMLEMDHEISIITESVVTEEQLHWFPESRKLNWLTYKDVQEKKFDLCIATWWRTVFNLKRVNANHYAYFVQSIESRFYPENEVILRNLIELTYSLDLEIITEASWIKQYLKEKYEKEAYLVLNGIDKESFSTAVEPYSPRNPDKVRLLVEGPLGVSFKNTELALKLAKRSKVDEVWFLTSTNILFYPKVDKLYSRVPVTQVGRVYASCDILLKLSTVEGMFGPPLEAFHCGATSVTYDVTGFDEYIIANKNALVSFSRTDEDVLDKINSLVENPNLLNSLKMEAIETARKWPSWDQSSKVFEEVCAKIIAKPITQNIMKIGHESNLLWEMYQSSLFLKNRDGVFNHLKRKFANSVHSKSPLLYDLLQKVYRTVKGVLERIGRKFF